jgi:phospholipase/lecithinase/hemolysin
MKSNIRPLAITALSLSLSFFSNAATAYTSLYAFGDSLTDSGNVYAATGGTLPDNPLNYPGRFGNGPTWVEKLATDHLGISAITPSLAGGTNHAWGGAWTDGGGSVPTVLGQISQYTGGGGTFGATDLVTVWAGANDFFFGVTDPSITAANMGTAFTMLAGAGARNILILNLPDLAKTPDIQDLGAPTAAQFSALVGGYNALLSAEIASQRSALGINLIEADMYSLYEEMQSNPSLYGLDNITDRSSFDPLINPDTALYWDGVHPTDLVHGFVAERAAQALGIPEPSSTLLIMSVSFVAILRRRRVAA